MSQTACWMFNTLDQCAWVGFGYGSRFDTSSYWISYAGLMHLAKFHDLNSLLHFASFNDDDRLKPYTIEEMFSWDIEYLHEKSSIYIKIQGDNKELSNKWFKDFIYLVKKYHDQGGSQWSMGHPAWFYYHQWERPKYFGSDWEPIYRMEQMYDQARDSLWCRKKSKGINWLGTSAPKSDVPEEKEPDPYGRLSWEDIADNDFLNDKPKEKEPEITEDFSVINEWSGEEEVYLISHWSTDVRENDWKWELISWDDPSASYSHEIRREWDVLPQSIQWKATIPHNWYIFGGDPSNQSPDHWTSRSCPTQGSDHLIFGGPTKKIQFYKISDPNALNRYYK